MGKAKQAEGQMRGAAADMKDQCSSRAEPKPSPKILKAKPKKPWVKATGDLGDQMAGRAKQLESQARNTVEDHQRYGPRHAQLKADFLLRKTPLVYRGRYCWRHSSLSFSLNKIRSGDYHG
jgi:uncharacterized protein YjbJ (UPF0337 family)